MLCARAAFSPDFLFVQILGAGPRFDPGAVVTQERDFITLFLLVIATEFLNLPKGMIARLAKLMDW